MKRRNKLSKHEGNPCSQAPCTHPAPHAAPRCTMTAWRGHTSGSHGSAFKELKCHDLKGHLQSIFHISALSYRHPDQGYDLFHCQLLNDSRGLGIFFRKCGYKIISSAMNTCKATCEIFSGKHRLWEEWEKTGCRGVCRR